MNLHAVAIRNLIGPLWAAHERSPYLRHYSRLKQTQFEGKDRVEADQLQKLKRLLIHANETVPFYRKRFADAGFDPANFQSRAQLEVVPVLTKSEIRTVGRALISEAYRDRPDLRRKTTSGSTGVSLEVWVDEEAMQFKRGCTLRCDEWSGWRFGEPVAMVWGNPDYLKHGWRGRLRNGLLERACYLDTLKMDEATMARFADDLVRRPPSLIFGHAHSVYLFAAFMRQHRTGSIRPRGIITTAMVLHDWQRQVIEAEFSCKVTNRYGCEEVSLIACECEKHEGLHVNTDGQYVELIRDGRPVGPGEPGSIIVTDLVNHAMPLIRYQVGDVASWAGRPCSCGRTGMPLLARIEGREADYVTTRRGELISGISLTENFAMLVPGIEQLQIIQESLERFTFRIVRGPDYGPSSDARIQELAAERFGDDVAYDCEFVERIPPELSGKYRFCISKVPNAFSMSALTEIS
ncbi:phenylacetate--CoA ligase family protein [Tautonia marina]|uniref:phenylacetate--CoA ligase family protein n=1 Tax=Tautonia marina TaxID=2653855 RepID=UPI0012610A1F|nr:phenylacetate--CoA ligase family protein [Tautonia marina]